MKSDQPDARRVTHGQGVRKHVQPYVGWVFQRSDSSLVVAGAVFFEVISVILLAPVASVAIDRLPRKAVLVSADLARDDRAGGAVHDGAVADLRRCAADG